LAFSPLTDIRSFVHNYLLDENLLDVKTLQAQLETCVTSSPSPPMCASALTLSHASKTSTRNASPIAAAASPTPMSPAAPRGDVYLDELKSRRSNWIPPNWNFSVTRFSATNSAEACVLPNRR
jgi:hypothetical protein